jgi:tRNA(Ile)-lysidine synthase
MSEPLAITAAEFAGLMDRLEPFEAAPALALAVSGGADSMALALLASAWANNRGGSVTALVVDHGLRPDATAEAQLTQARLRDRGIVTQILTRTGPVPSGDLQAFARRARYRLLGQWCRDQGILHLVTAHHRDDQAETLLLRLARGSGLAGLAAMPPITDLASCRLLRPFLGIPSNRLRATLLGAGWSWCEDPSNRNEAFARVRVRNSAHHLEALGLDPARLAATASHLGRARAAIEEQVARLLAAAVMIHPAGFAALDRQAMLAAPSDVTLRALASVVTCIGGQAVTPRFERLDGLRTAIEGQGFRPRTLAGCRIAPERGAILVFRELAAVAAPATLDNAPIRWDNRFVVSHLGKNPAPASLSVGALGPEDADILKRLPDLASVDIPRRVWPTLPTLRRQGTILEVPHLDWAAPKTADETGIEGLVARFCPRRALTGSGFSVV